METAILEAAMQSAVQQAGLEAIHWFFTLAVVTAALLSAAWMAAGLLSRPREF
jgi:hypothetical protein